MKKKFTNDEIGQVIGRIADKIRSDMDYKYRIAESQMLLAENDLIDSLKGEQIELYSDFAQKREDFYCIAKELYEKKF